MALESTTAKYEIQVVKTGTGAAAAVQEFNQVAAAANTASTTAAAGTQKFKGLEATTKTTTASLRALAPVATMIGGTVFPQMSSNILLVTSGLQSMREAAIASGMGLAATSTAAAGLAAGVWTVVESFRALKAAQEETLSAQNADATAAKIAERLKKATIDAVEAGALELTDVQSRILDNIFERPNIENVRVAQGMLKGKIPEGFFKSDSDARGLAQERIADFEREKQLLQEIGLSIGNIKVDEDYLYNLHVQRLDLYRQLRREGLITENELRAFTDESAIRWLQQSRAVKKEFSDIQRIGLKTGQMLSAGLAEAFVAFASGTQSAGDAFKSFARSFMMQLAEMIIQAAILAAIMKALGMASGSYGSTFTTLLGGGTPAAKGGVFGADGVQFMAAGGLAGVKSVSRPTFFPRFNVIAGEAGSEMLTVLAKPRMMEVGGMQAVVGNAAGNRLAITNADELARGGAGGSVQIHVTLDQGLRAEIVDQSVKGAVVTITTEMDRDSKLRRAVRKASN